MSSDRGSMKHRKKKEKIYSVRHTDTQADDEDSSSMSKKKNIKKNKLDSIGYSEDATRDQQTSEESDEEMDEEQDNTSESEHSETNDEYAQLKKEMSEMPFEELQKLKQKIGLKMYSQVFHSDREKPSTSQSFKRENKNRPAEMSSKKRPPRLREVVHVKKKHKRDPRFDDLSGEYSEQLFRQSYGFLSDIKQREKDVVLNKYKEEQDADKKKELGDLLKRLSAHEQSEKAKEQRQQRLQQLKTKERELVKDGKRPFYLKQADKKKLDLAEKFKELKKAGKVDKYMQKKRKKNASKEKRKLPNT